MIKTTVVGSQMLRRERVLSRHGVARQTAATFAGLSDAEVEGLVRRQIGQVIADQVTAGLDILSEGEVTRLNYWSYFALSLNGTKMGVPRDNCAIVHITDELSLNLTYMIDDWKTAQSFTDRPVKITIPGPLTCASYVIDEFYHSREALCLAFAKVIREYVRLLSDAGCRYIQIDDCQLAYQPDVALNYGLSHLAICFDEAGPDVTRVLHICRGRPGFVTEYESCGKAPNKGCYDIVLSEANRIAADVISLEHAFYSTPVSVFKRLTNQTLMLGVVDVCTKDVESVETIIDMARSVMDVLDPARIILAPDCGFGHWNAFLHDESFWIAAQAKLRNMTQAAKIMNSCA